MKNTITLTIPFSFKGENHTPSVIIDLNVYCQQTHDMEVLSHRVATENKIGNYSYEYEVLHASKHHFSNATGDAEGFLSNGVFDFEGFKENSGKAQIFKVLQSIAKKTMGIDDLEAHDTLKLALEQAYRAGKDKDLF